MPDRVIASIQYHKKPRFGVTKNGRTITYRCNCVECASDRGAMERSSTSRAVTVVKTKRKKATVQRLPVWKCPRSVFWVIATSLGVGIYGAVLISWSAWLIPVLVIASTVIAGMASAARTRMKVRREAKQVETASAEARYRGHTEWVESKRVDKPAQQAIENRDAEHWCSGCNQTVVLQEMGWDKAGVHYRCLDCLCLRDDGYDDCTCDRCKRAWFTAETAFLQLWLDAEAEYLSVESLPAAEDHKPNLEPLYVEQIHKMQDLLEKAAKDRDTLINRCDQLTETVRVLERKLETQRAGSKRRIATTQRMAVEGGSFELVGESFQNDLIVRVFKQVIHRRQLEVTRTVRTGCDDCQDKATKIVQWGGQTVQYAHPKCGSCRDDEPMDSFDDWGSW